MTHVCFSHITVGVKSYYLCMMQIGISQFFKIFDVGVILIFNFLLKRSPCNFSLLLYKNIIFCNFVFIFSDGFLAKYCIFNKGHLQTYKYTFDIVSDYLLHNTLLLVLLLLKFCLLAHQQFFSCMRQDQA